MIVYVDTSLLIHVCVFTFHEVDDMGRPRIEKKRAKRKRQKIRRTSNHVSLRNDVSFSSELNNDGPPEHIPTCSSPVLFSEYSSVSASNPENKSTFPAQTCTAQSVANNQSFPYNSTSIGDDDTDLIEMDLYDVYREEDGGLYTNEKCTEKLKRKLKEGRIRLNELLKENMEMKVQHKEEKERIRKFYDTIAFGRSRSGRMVRTAMGTSSAAGKIIEELRNLYSVEQDCNFY